VPAQEYWPVMIGAVRQTHPEFCFIAEAYWDMELALQEQGFDFCYDKRLYDRLVVGDAAGVGAHLAADVAFQDRLVRFAENHDEPRLAAVVDPARARAIAVATLTQTGARLVHQGQLEGRRVHLPVFLGRLPREEVDDDLAEFYRSLLMTLRDSMFRSGTWNLCEAPLPLAGWAWTGVRRWLVIVNLSDAPASGRVSMSWADGLQSGLSVELDAWQFRLVDVEAP
jgi:hypothetical protein